MPILQDMPIILSPEDIIASRGSGKTRPDLLRNAREAIALGAGLWQPKAVYDWFDVRAVEGEQISLIAPSQSGGEHVLRVGPKSDLLAHAQRVLVGVITIGPALEQRVNELQTDGESLRAYLLDSAGVVALGAAGEAVRCLVQDTATELDWGVSAALSPGSLVGWSLRGQRELCSLLPLGDIGVELTRHCVLMPHKSVSVVIGIGPGYDSAHVGSVCKYCALQDSCWRRREDPS